ncbi:hypothetical protein [Hyalangium versicolor]|uniref:hypothetical protein n=1 Tax=Hyalangium versicolor TaxID=2861190 RepID=UPI001CC92652|nr:hypothetical protein [Hyalangium versicolor]
MFRLALPLLLGIGLLVPSPSHACSCADGQVVFPKEGTVPPNVVFHIRWWRPIPLRLVDEHGEKIPLSTEQIGDRLLRLTPNNLLEGGKRYTLEPEGKPQDSKWPPIASYRVEGEPDTTPPSPPAAAQFHYEHTLVNFGNSCKTEHEGYTVLTEGAADDHTGRAQLATLVVSASNPEEVLALLRPDDDFIGQSTCFYNFDVQSFAGAQVALRSVDLAGNRSAPGQVFGLQQHMPLWISLVLLTTRGRVLLIMFVSILIGLVLLVARGTGRPSATPTRE